MVYFLNQRFLHADIYLVDRMYRNEGKEMGVAHQFIKTINWLEEIFFCPYNLDGLGGPNAWRMNASLRQRSHISDKMEAETVF